jgi:hypothetical protein
MSARRKQHQSAPTHLGFFQPSLLSSLFTMRTFALALVTVLSLFQGSLAAPASAVEARDCASIPSTADPAIRDQVYRITQSRGVTAKVLLSTFEVRQSCLFRARM